MFPIYLDNHATTMTDPRVLEVMEPWLQECGNPASRSHQHGWKAEEVVETAREKVAAFVGAKPTEIFFTGGATESNNTVLKSFKGKIITTQIEHKSILEPCGSGDLIAKIGVSHTGIVDPTKITCRLWPDMLVSVMMANNEVGSIQPVDKVVNIVNSLSFKAFVHSDMAQAVGKIPLNFETLGIHFASFSAHKMYGPKGIGALYAREDSFSRLSPLIQGGGQERGLRSGTLNVPAIVGFGKACEIAQMELAQESIRIGQLRDKLQETLQKAIPEMKVHGANRIQGNLHFSIPCTDMNAFMAFVTNGVSLSLGSACMSNNGKSHVLEAMGIVDDEIKRSVRICIGRFNTAAEIDFAADIIAKALDKANGKI